MNHFSRDACLVDCATTHTILRDKKYFSNLTLVPFNVQTISSSVDLIKGLRRAIIILPNGTKFQIDDVLYSNKSNRNLLSFKDVRINGYHIENINHNGNGYLLITGSKTNLRTIDFFIMWIISNNY